jgi:hypothetical protein
VLPHADSCGQQQSRQLVQASMFPTITVLQGWLDGRGRVGLWLVVIRISHCITKKRQDEVVLLHVQDRSD